MKQIKKEVIFTNPGCLADKFINDIKRHRPLTREKERELLLIIKKGDGEAEAARKEIIESNCGFLVTVAKQYYSPYVPLAEMVSAGALGLMASIGSYDMDSEVRLITHAVRYINHEMVGVINQYRNLITLPGNAYKELARYERLCRRLQCSEQRDATIEEFLEEQQAVSSTIREAILATRRMESLDEPVGGDEDMCMLDVIDSGTGTDGEFERRSLRGVLRRTLWQVLPRTEYDVLVKSLELDGGIHTDCSIAMEYHRGTEWVEAKRRKALEMIRDSPERKKIYGLIHNL